jgi:uncharacterized protein (TIGR02117 family)
LFLLWVICACAGPLTQQSYRGGENLAANVFVVHDDWHSAVVLRTADLSPEMLPELRDFPGAKYLEFSWGDREYFPHPDPGVGLALKAAFWSSGSILHVVGVSDSPAISYPNAEIITIGLPAAGFQRLVKFVSETFSRSHLESSEARPGLSANARFYLAQGRFSILRTCNTWVAEALQAAELPIAPGWVITAASLGRHARPLGNRQ